MRPRMLMARSAVPRPSQNGDVPQPQGPIGDLLTWAEARVTPLLERLPRGPAEGDSDERWYWAAPLLLNTHDDWWARRDLAAEWTGWDKRASAQESRWQEHVDLARS